MTNPTTQNAPDPVFKRHGGDKKAESLTHISVGQRPTSAVCINIKAESLTDCGAGNGRFFMRKAYSLEKLYLPLRRALPYANMQKAFSLGKFHFPRREETRTFFCNPRSKPHPKAESLVHISVGQRPTYGTSRRLKAESLVHISVGQRPTSGTSRRLKAESLVHISVGQRPTSVCG